jgi:tRNA(Ile)-lysidine synthetase-like protein
MSLVKKFLDSELKHRLLWQEVGPDQTGAIGRQTEERDAVIKRAYKINAVDFFSNPGIIRLYSLYAVFDALKKDGKGKGHHRLPYRFLAALIESGNIINNHVLAKGLGLRIVKRSPDLFFERDIVDTGKKGYFIAVVEQPENHSIGDKTITYQILTIDSDIHMQTDNALWINLEFVSPPLMIRSRRTGDKIQIKSGAKSIKKLYNEWSVALHERWQIPLIADKYNILGIYGKPFGYHNRLNTTIEAARKKVKAKSKFLRVEVT